MLALLPVAAMTLVSRLNLNESKKHDVWCVISITNIVTCKSEYTYILCTSQHSCISTSEASASPPDVHWGKQSDPAEGVKGR